VHARVFDSLDHKETNDHCNKAGISEKLRFWSDGRKYTFVVKNDTANPFL